MHESTCIRVCCGRLIRQAFCRVLPGRVVDDAADRGYDIIVVGSWQPSKLIGALGRLGLELESCCVQPHSEHGKQTLSGLEQYLSI